MRQKGIIFLPVLIIIALVGVLGYFVYQNSQLRINFENLPAQRDTKTSATPIPSPPPDLKDNWENYVNNDHKYSVKYPNNYLRLICPKEELTLTVRDNDARPGPIEMESCARGGRYTLETRTYNTIQEAPEETIYYTIEKKDITLDGIPATQYTFTFTNIEDGPYPIWYTIAQVNMNGKSYQIYFDDKENLSTFEKILSTFKFTQ